MYSTALKTRIPPLGVLAALLIGVLATPCAMAATTGPGCNKIDERGSAGPWDYRDKSPGNVGNLRVVEVNHFLPKHQRGALRGDVSVDVGVWWNLDYTLRAIPNHPHALYLLALFEHQIAQNSPDYFAKLKQNPGYSPAECYFRRAAGYAPDDASVPTALGVFMNRVGQAEKAVEVFKSALKLAPGSAKAHYNLGLAYYAAKKFPEAAASARKAYALGYKKGDLKRLLAANGHW